jgi:hypothetical protein
MSFFVEMPRARSSASLTIQPLHVAADGATTYTFTLAPAPFRDDLGAATAFSGYYLATHASIRSAYDEEAHRARAWPSAASRYRPREKVPKNTYLQNPRLTLPSY